MPRRLRRTWHRIVLGAEHEVNAAGHRRVGSEHLLVAIVGLGDGTGATWLRARGVEPAHVRALVRDEVDRRGGDPHGLDPRDLRELGLPPMRIPVVGGVSQRRRRHWSPDAAAVVHTAYESARRAGRRAPIADDLLLGLVDTRGCRAHRTLVRLGVDVAELRAIVLRGGPPPSPVGV